MKMFSSTTPPVYPGINDNEAGLSEESLYRIAQLLTENKYVVVMSRGNPFKIYKDENGEIKIEPLENFKYE